MALHGYVNTTKCTCWDVDSYNLAGVYTDADMDNAVLVTLVKMNLDSENNIGGYEYTVKPATSTDTSVWIVDSPEVGSTLMQQMMADPREFYNEAGRTMSLKFMNPKVDCIEVTKEAFEGGTMPDAVTNKYVVAGANGKLKATNSNAGTGILFNFEGFHNVTIGMAEVQTAVLRCVRN